MTTHPVPAPAWGPARSWRPWLALLCLCLGLACTLQLISPYDEQIDKSATALQQDMDTFLTRLAEQGATGAAAGAASYEANRDFYAKYAVSLRSMLLRARAHPKNDRTEQQIELMMDSVETLRKAHQESPPSPEAVDIYRKLFNQSWGAVIALEVAKKRGD